MEEAYKASGKNEKSPSILHHVRYILQVLCRIPPTMPEQIMNTPLHMVRLRIIHGHTCNWLIDRVSFSCYMYLYEVGLC